MLTHSKAPSQLTLRSGSLQCSPVFRLKRKTYVITDNNSDLDNHVRSCVCICLPFIYHTIDDSQNDSYIKLM